MLYDDSNNIPELSDMPLLEWLVKKHKSSQPLKGTKALFFQHQLGNQVPMTQAMISLGLEPENITWVDIPYTSNADVRNYMIEHLGIPDTNFINCVDYSLLSAYDAYQQKRSIRIYQELLSSAHGRLLVMDDGAYFLEAASCFEELPAGTCIVEQTNRGFIKVDKNSAMRHIMGKVPLADVARSTLKSLIESPCIGASVCASIDHHLRKKANHLKKADSSNLLVHGYGNIGKSVVKFLIDELGYSKDRTFINDPNKTVEIIADGYNVWNNNINSLFDIVVGCSGTTSFDIGDYVFLNDGAILVSASSGAVEFNRKNIVEWAELSESDNIEVTVDEDSNQHPLHKDIKIKFPGRTVVLLNGGFPINFDGRINCVASNHIQITMALMVQAAIQAVSAEKSGIIMPDYDISRELVRLFYTQGSCELNWFPTETEVLEQLKKSYS